MYTRGDCRHLSYRHNGKQLYVKQPLPVCVNRGMIVVVAYRRGDNCYFSFGHLLPLVVSEAKPECGLGNNASFEIPVFDVIPISKCRSL